MPNRWLFWSVLVVLCTLSQRVGAFTFILDGNVVGPGAEWDDSHITVIDDNDERESADGGLQFNDHEDIDRMHVYFDMDQDMIHWTVGVFDQLYPNRLWAYPSGIRNRCYPSIAFDLDNDQETGSLTDKNHHGELTFAYPLMGFDMAIQTNFDDSDDGSKFQRGEEVNGRYNLPVGPDYPFIRFALGYDGDGGVEGGPNANWLEASADLPGLREVVFNVDQTVAFKKGDTVGIAGIIGSPVPLGDWGEEITNAAYYHLGWGPVDWNEDDGAVTLNTPEIPDGLAVTYDADTDAFLVATTPVTSFSVSPHMGTPASVNPSTWGTIKALYR